MTDEDFEYFIFFIFPVPIPVLLLVTSKCQFFPLRRFLHQLLCAIGSTSPQFLVIAFIFAINSILTKYLSLSYHLTYQTTNKLLSLTSNSDKLYILVFVVRLSKQLFSDITKKKCERSTSNVPAAVHFSPSYWWMNGVHMLFQTTTEIPMPSHTS